MSDYSKLTGNVVKNYDAYFTRANGTVDKKPHHCLYITEDDDYWYMMGGDLIVIHKTDPDAVKNTPRIGLSFSHEFRGKIVDVIKPLLEKHYDGVNSYHQIIISRAESGLQYGNTFCFEHVYAIRNGIEVDIRAELHEVAKIAKINKIRETKVDSILR